MFFENIVCDSPILIPNKNLGRKFSSGSPSSLKDCTSAFIKVNCGHCPSCIANKQMQLVQRVQMQCLGFHPFFCTLTYNEDSLPRLTTSTGFDIPFADIRDFQTMIKRLRKNNCFGRKFKYFAVSERGSEKGRPHFHCLFFVEKFPDDTYLSVLNLEDTLKKEVLSNWVRFSKVGRYSQSSPLCTYKVKYLNGRRYTNYDLHYITTSFDEKDETSVAFYVLKYMLKPSDKDTRLQQALHLNLPSDEYDSVWPIVRSRYFNSKDFGDSRNEEVRFYLRSCIRDSVKSGMLYPEFINPNTGQHFPLSRFYRNKPDIYSFDDALSFYYKNDSPFIDSVVLPEDTPSEELHKRHFNLSKYEKILQNHVNDCVSDFLFE